MAVSVAGISHYAPRFLIKINNAEIAAEVSHTIKSVVIEQELNTTNSFRFEVQDEFRGHGFKSLGHELFKFGNAVSIAMGYTGNLVKMVEGKIQDISAVFVQGIAPSFTVEGADSFYVFLTTPGDAVTFTKKTDSQIVTKIAQKAQMEADVDDTTQVHPTKTKNGGESFFNFLQDLAADNGFGLTLAGRRLKFKAPQRGAGPVLGLIWGKDLISFHPRLNTSQALSEVVVRSWDRTNRQMIEARARAGEERQQEGNRRLGSNVVREIYGDVVKVITDRPVRSVEQAREIARAELERASDTFITGTAETIGMPQLQPGMCLHIGGLGTWFSGKYYIQKVTHRIDAGGYRSSLEMKRNAL